MNDDKNNDNSFWSSARGLLQELLDECKQKLDSESIKEVQHYITHDEYEMAFEGMFLELIKLGYYPEAICSNKYIGLGKSLRLDIESVFSPDFWTSYRQYCKIRKVNLSSKNAM